MSDDHRDLLIKSMAFTPSAPTASAPTTIALLVKNNGGAATAASVTRIYRSINGKLEKGTDPLVTTLPLGALAPGASVTQSASVTLPAGTSYISAVVDDDAAIAEVSETNNLKKAKPTITP